jgi:tetratricopeptide (TPR) repeat protein
MVPVEKMEIGRTLMCLGDAALTYHEMKQARSFYEEAVTVWRDFGDLNLLAYSIRRLGQVAWRDGNYEKAARLYKESLILNQETADRRGMLACLVSFSTLASAQEDFERAAVLAVAVQTQLASTGTRLLPVDNMNLDASFTILCVQIEEKTLDEFRARGKMLTLEQAIAYALEDR